MKPIKYLEPVLVFSLLVMTLFISSCSDKEQEYTQLETCVNHYQAESYRVAEKECAIAAQQGSSHAQWLMANLYRYALTKEGADLEGAFKWYLQAAENGHVAAMREVGQAYMYEEGVEKDFEKAHLWLKKAAENRDTEAEFLVGVLFYEGWGRDKDIGSSISWFKRAATNDHSMSINNLAWVFSTSEVPAYYKPKRAKFWIDKLDKKLLDDSPGGSEESSQEDPKSKAKTKSNGNSQNKSIFLDTKAAVMAANKDFEQAVKFQNQAIAQLPSDTPEEQLVIYQQHLDNYLQGKDWRE